MGLEPEERKIPIQEWKDAAASGELAEVFACGTAAVITLVGELKWAGGSVDHRRPTTRTPSFLGCGSSTSSTGGPCDTRGWLTRLA